jgi:aryl-alcohol dehydrogenase-like predicted oxidoreductase
MEYRELGTTGYKVSTISFGAWAIGGSWGAVQDDLSRAALHRALDLGVNFIDTADVYGDGRSERLIRSVLRERNERVYVATKAGRRLDPHVAAGYTLPQLTAFVERSLENLGMEALDLLQLHCPPGPVYDTPAVFEALDTLQRQGKIRAYGVSVETVEEAEKALRYPGVQSVQIIFNMFRLKPSEQFFGAAEARRVGIIARVPLASGLLTGKITPSTQFAPDDHRSYHRHGESFDRGETFSGVDLDAAFAALEALKPLVPAGVTLSQFALRWILMFPAVTCAIPGARRPEQAQENVRAADLPWLDAATMTAVQRVYDQHIRGLVHHLW